MCNLWVIVSGMCVGVWGGGQVLSIILSYIFIPKPLNAKHVIGGLLFAASIAITLYRKVRGRGDRVN